MDPVEDEVLRSASRQADRIVKLKIGKKIGRMSVGRKE